MIDGFISIAGWGQIVMSKKHWSTIGSSGTDIKLGNTSLRSSSNKMLLLPLLQTIEMGGGESAFRFCRDLASCKCIAGKAVN